MVYTGNVLFDIITQDTNKGFYQYEDQISDHGVEVEKQWQ